MHGPQNIKSVVDYVQIPTLQFFIALYYSFILIYCSVFSLRIAIHSRNM